MHRSIGQLFCNAAILAAVALLFSASAAELNFDKKEKRAQAEIARLETLLASAPEMQRAIIQRDISEIRAALENNRRPSVPAYIDFIEVPIRAADAFRNRIGVGRTPANNLGYSENENETDLSRRDPIPSTFWNRPSGIGSSDLYIGFDRKKLPQFETTIWTYAGRKKHGWNAGCELTSGDQRIKVKFAETHSEPFTSRIFHALGYNVDATDYASEIKIKYDRRFFLEFNSRKAPQMKFGMFFIPMLQVTIEKKHSPFDSIAAAVLKTGERISATELQAQLFDTGFESKVDYLVTKPANVQVQSPDVAAIGPWTFGGNDHDNLRELRGAGVLAAWLGWWDSRFENTRLRIVQTPSGPALKHVWSDLGGGLGRAAGSFSHSCEKPDDFDWSFTRSRVSSDKLYFHIDGYEPVEDTPAFAAMTLDDARWMARLIAQLTERQIIDALTASGFPPPEVHLYTEKLISRRDRLIRDLQLTREIALLRPDGPRHHPTPKLLSQSR